MPRPDGPCWSAGTPPAGGSASSASTAIRRSRRPKDLTLPVRVVARPSLLSGERRIITVAYGPTIRDLVAQVETRPEVRPYLCAFIGADLVPRERWGHVRPLPGADVRIVLVPQGGGGSKAALRIVAQLAIVAAAVATGQFYLASFAGATALGAAVVTSAAAAVLSLALNALIPPPVPKLGELGGSKDKQVYSLDGARNVINLFGVVPRVLGFHRFVPPQGARAYTELVGDDQYLRLLFEWGAGPLELSDFRLGSTPIDHFEGVELEHRYGLPGDAPLTLFPGSIVQQSLDVELKAATGWVVRRSEADADELSVDIGFLRGLVQFDKSDGRRENRTVAVEIAYAPAGGSTWTLVTTLTVTARSTELLRRGHRWKPAARGQYDVRLRRTTPDVTNDRVFDAVHWTTLRTITNEDPIAQKNVAKTALRIKASGQAQGYVDQFGALAKSVALDWNGSAWVSRASNNPAALFRLILQDASLDEPLADGRIDLVTLQSWHAECAAEGWTFNAVLDSAGSLLEALQAVAAAGRGRPILRDGRWSVVRDRSQNAPSQAFSMRDCWGFKAEHELVDLPHAWRVRFVNEAADYQQDERIVYADGYDSTNAKRFETLDLLGVTTSDLAWKAGRYHHAQLALRPAVYSFETWFKSLVAMEGDLVVVGHDVPLWGYGAGRIRAMGENAAGDVLWLELDEQLALGAGIKLARITHRDGTQSLHELLPGETFVETTEWLLATQAGDTIVTEAGDTLLADVATTTISSASSRLDLVTPIPVADAPDVGDLVMLGDPGREAWLVVKHIARQDDHTARLTVMDAAPAVHLAHLGPIPPFDSKITLPPGELVPAIASLVSDERVMVRDADGALTAQIQVAFTPGAYRLAARLPQHIEVQWTDDPPGAWTPLLVPAAAAQALIAPVEEGQTYQVRARYVHRDGSYGPWAGPVKHKVVGKTSPPPDVPFAIVDAGLFIWRYSVPPPDFAGFRVRWGTRPDEPWETAYPAHDGLITDTVFDLARIPQQALATLLVKAVDVSGNESRNAARAAFAQGDGIFRVPIAVADHAQLGWPGTLSNGVRTPEGRIKASDSSVWLEPAGGAWLSPVDGPWLPGVFKEMTYIAEHRVPANARQTDRIRVEVGADAAWTLHYRIGWWGIVGDPDAEGLLATDGFGFVDDASDANQRWPGSAPARAGQTLTFTLACRGTITAFRVIHEAEELGESVPAVAIPAAGVRVPVRNAYRGIRTVQALVHAGSAMRRVERVVTPEDAAQGPLIRGFDAANAAAAGTADIDIKGF